MADEYLQEILERLKKLQAAGHAVHEAQRLLDVSRVYKGYVWFRLDRKYLEGYITAWKCLEDLLPLSQNDNQEIIEDRPS